MILGMTLPVFGGVLAGGIVGLLLLTMVISRSCTRSNVVKRALHAPQSRRRLMAAPSSAGRESFT